MPRKVKFNICKCRNQQQADEEHISVVTDNQKFLFLAHINNMSRIQRTGHCRNHFRKPNQPDGKRIFGELIHPPAQKRSEHPECQNDKKSSHKKIPKFFNLQCFDWFQRNHFANVKEYFSDFIFKTIYLHIMNWIILIIAGLFETGFATCLGKAQETSGRESFFWWAGFVMCLVMSMFLMFKAISGQGAIPIGTAYAVWTGIGAVGGVLMGILLFHEPATFWRMFFVVTLIASVVGLKMVSH